MPTLFKPTFTDKATGERRPASLWYARIRGKRVPLGVADKRLAERKAAELERHAELGHDPARLDRARRRPLAEHLLAFEDSLVSKGLTGKHVAGVLGRLRRLAAGCRLATLADAAAAPVEAWLAREQRDGRMSAQTRKHYAVHAKQFGGWAARGGLCAANPFAGLKTDLHVENDRRRRRRALTADECARLLAAAGASRRTIGGMAGPHRRVLYMLALTTGLRRNELGSLTAASFRLGDATPTVTVEGAAAKNRRAATLPLRADLAAELRGWLPGRPAGRPLFPVKDAKRRAMIHADLKAAGIAVEVGGLVVDLHALRATFVTLLVLGGVPLAVTQRLARHSDPRLTSNVYTVLGVADLGRAVECLLPMGGPPAAG